MKIIRLQSSNWPGRNFPGALGRSLKIMLVCCGLLFSSLGHAEFLGSANGRTADLTRLPDFSLELSFNTGDFSFLDYRNIGLRANYRFSPGIMLFGDIGLAEVGREDAVGLGAGLFYQLDGLFENIDAAVKASYHIGDFGRFIDLDILALEFLISGLEPVSSNGLMWYANVGIHRNDGGLFSDTDFGFGGGVVLPVSSGEAFLGLDLIDEITFSLGYRYFFN